MTRLLGKAAAVCEVLIGTCRSVLVVRVLLSASCILELATTWNLVATMLGLSSDPGISPPAAPQLVAYEGKYANTTSCCVTASCYDLQRLEPLIDTL